MPPPPPSSGPRRHLQQGLEGRLRPAESAEQAGEVEPDLGVVGTGQNVEFQSVNYFLGQNVEWMGKSGVVGTGRSWRGSESKRSRSG